MRPRLDVWISRFVIVGFHAACLLAFVSGYSASALAVCLICYLVRGFGITAGYHRYFSHRSFKTNRVFQACLGILGCIAVQGGPLKWSRDHRHHHRKSDTEEDLHSPKWPNFLWSHLTWMVSSKETKIEANVSDLEAYPELRWIDRLQLVFIALFVAGLYVLGESLGAAFETSGLQMVVWGFFISTVVTWHITWCVNSVTHTWGSRRFETSDDSRNNWLVGIFALGEGHHNNHHAHPGLARQGLFWWEIDVSYYVLRVLQAIGLVWDLNEPTPEVYASAKTLSKVRRSLKRRGLCPATCSGKLREIQKVLATAVNSMASLRSRCAKMLKAGAITEAEMSKRIEVGTDEFAAKLHAIEALAQA